MSLHVYNDLEQGTDEWHDARRGIVTASIIGKLLTPTLKVADNDTSRGVTLTLAAERITGFTEDVYVTADMERGTLDEPYARDLYSGYYDPVDECGFMVRQFDGYQIGFSPDGLVGDDGLIEIKSRKQKVQLATILADAVPLENMAQCQAGLLVSGREWLDYVSFSGGMPLWTKRVLPDPRWFDAINAAAKQAEKTAAEMVERYTEATRGLPATERVDHYADMVI